MATSKLDVWNMAVGACGKSTTIASLTEASKEAKACGRFYDQCLEYVLGDAYWGMATKAAALALTAQEYPGYAYTYQYPSDCVVMRIVSDSQGERLTYGNVFNRLEDLNMIPTRVPFKIIAATNLQSRVIATDLADAYGIYTARVTTPAVWGAAFTEALAYRLAWKIAPTLNVDPDMIQQLLQLYMMERGKAGEHDLNEQRPDPEPDSPSIAIRG